METFTHHLIEPGAGTDACKALAVGGLGEHRFAAAGIEIRLVILDEIKPLFEALGLFHHLHGLPAGGNHRITAAEEKGAVQGQHLGLDRLVVLQHIVAQVCRVTAA